MPVVFRVVNVPMRLILSLRISTPLSNRLMLVYLTDARAAGITASRSATCAKARRCSLRVEDAGSSISSTGNPHVRLRGRDISLRPELVRDPVEVDRLLGVMSATNPTVGRFVPIPKQADGHYDRDRLNLAIRHGFRIVRWSAHDAAARQTLTR